LQPINWDFVRVLVRSRAFVNGVKLFNRRGNLEDLLWYGADALRDFVNFKKSYENNFHDVYKSVMYAKDLIKMNDFKIVYSKSNRYHSVVNRTRVYPRSTANDVYVRDFRLEDEEAYARSICCMPYDCMCYEAYDSFGEIWRKAEDVHCFHLKVRELINNYEDFVCPDCGSTED